MQKILPTSSFEPVTLHMTQAGANALPTDPLARLISYNSTLPFGPKKSQTCCSKYIATTETTGGEFSVFRRKGVLINPFSVKFTLLA